jgi:hypothetical protein
MHRQGESPGANLVLGPEAEDTRVALALGERVEWPIAKSGYRFDDVTSYNTFSYDYLFGFDRFQGLYAGSESISGGTFLH